MAGSTRVYALSLIAVTAFLAVLWTLLMTDKFLHTPWIWSNKYLLNMQITLYTLKSKKGVRRSVLKKLLAKAGMQDVDRLVKRRLWLNEAVTTVMHLGLLPEQPWRHLLWATRIMLLCGFLTLGLLWVVCAHLCWHVKKGGEIYRGHVFGALCAAPMVAMAGLLQYGVMTEEMRSETNSAFGNGFMISLLVSLMSLVPPALFNKLDRKLDQDEGHPNDTCGTSSVEMGVAAAPGSGPNWSWHGAAGAQVRPPSEGDPTSFAASSFDETSSMHASPSSRAAQPMGPAAGQMMPGAYDAARTPGACGAAAYGGAMAAGQYADGGARALGQYAYGGAARTLDAYGVNRMQDGRF